MLNPISWFAQLNKIMAALVVTDKVGKILDVEDGFSRLLKKTLQAKSKGKHIFFIGNGASASISSHIAADLCKNGKLRTHVFTDLALLTALVNDLGVENMFSAPLKQLASKGDMLIAISSSGKSPNILHGVRQARSMGLYIVTMTGMCPDNQLNRLGNLNFYLPAPTYGFAESGHAALLHYWVDSVIEFQNNSKRK